MLNQLPAFFSKSKIGHRICVCVSINSLPTPYLYKEGVQTLKDLTARFESRATGSLVKYQLFYGRYEGSTIDFGSCF